MCTGLVGAADEDADDAGAPAEPVWVLTAPFDAVTVTVGLAVPEFDEQAVANRATRPVSTAAARMRRTRLGICTPPR
jgi:hypothetical protein